MPKLKTRKPLAAPRSFTLAESQLTIMEAAAHLRVSRATIFRLMGNGKLKSVTIGTRRLILGREILRFMDSLAQSNAA